MTLLYIKMKVLFLGPDNPLIQWLSDFGEEVISKSDQITVEWCLEQEFDYVISYNYKHLIRPSILELYPSKIINLHISYLPYNRGMHPNVWSFVENTPKGVTIHFMEAGLDTGDILYQRKVNFGNLKIHTLTTTWQKLQDEIQLLFKDKWTFLRTGQVLARPQRHELATFHYGRELQKLGPDSWPQGWETPILDFLQDVQLRNKNNLQIPPTSQLPFQELPRTQSEEELQSFSG